MRKKAFIAISILLIFSSMSWAATCPSLNPQPSVTGVEDIRPTRVAAGEAGVIYVSDHFNADVTAYAKDGSRIEVLRVKRPAGIAVDSSGNIYVGISKDEKGTGMVAVYDRNFKMIRTLGSGDGEFKYPTDIKIANSRVYVADSQGNVVKMFNESDGSPIGTFGGYGDQGGKLMNPTALSVDPQTGNVYVTDKALQYDAVNKMWGMGSGVHIFTADGSYLRSLPVYFGDTPVEGSYLVVAPSGVHVDGSGNVFVTDQSESKIIVFDTEGNYTCEIPVGSVSMAPQGIIEGPDGRMFIAATDSVLVYATSNFVEMSVSPGEVSLDAQVCTTAENSATITVTNRGGGVLNWSASTAAPWLTVTPDSGSINGMASVNVTLTANPQGQGFGQHEGGVTFTSQGDASDVSVLFNSYPAPILKVAESGYSFEVRGDIVPSSEALNITLEGDITGKTLWTASSDSAWLGVSPSQGASSVSIAQVGISSSGLTGLSSGTFSGTVTVSTGCPDMASAVLPVSLTYYKGGTIKVSSNIDEASYTITGPENFTGSGKSFVVEVAPPGSYEVTFGGVTGFKAPAAQSIDVSYGNTAELTGNYADLRENNKIIVSSDKGNVVATYEMDGKELGVFAVAGSGNGKVSSTASGDVDGDGIDEIMVAHDSGVVTGYRADGSVMQGVEFTAFGFKSDVALAVADLNGDGRAEVLASPGSDNGDAADIRAFGLGSSGVYDTGMIFSAYQSRNGINSASGDINGDGVDEIVSTPGGSVSGRSIEVRAFSADVAAGPGAWKATEVNTFAGGKTYAGISVASADLNADGVDEIIVASEPVKDSGETEIAIYNVSGQKAGSFVVSGTGLVIAAGDIDFDGSAEIVAGDGNASIRVFDAAGSLKAGFTALEGTSSAGLKISLGQIVGQ